MRAWACYTMPSDVSRNVSWNLGSWRQTTMLEHANLWISSFWLSIRLLLPYNWRDQAWRWRVFKVLADMPGKQSVATADVAEWLRRLTRNQLGSPRAGSSPAVCEETNFLFLDSKPFFIDLCLWQCLCLLFSFKCWTWKCLLFMTVLVYSLVC